MKKSLIFLAAELLFLLLALPAKFPFILRLVFGLLSLACPIPQLLPGILEDIGGRRITRRLLVPAALLITLCVGRFVSAAVGMLIYVVASLLLERREDFSRSVVGTRLDMLELEDHGVAYDGEPHIVGKLYKFIRQYLTYIIWGAALITAVLTALFSRGGITEGVSRACVLIAVSCAAPLFSAFPTADYAACAAAAENGVVLTGGALPRLLEVNSVLLTAEQSKRFGSAEAVSVNPDFVKPDGLITLAATAWSPADGETARLLQELCPGKIDPSSISEFKELPGYGVIASIRDITVLAGSAELMKEGGLPLIGFNDAGDVMHVAVNGRYAGYIDLKADSVSDADLRGELGSMGIRIIDSLKRRGEEDRVLVASSEPPAEEDRHEGDVYALLGGLSEDADVYASGSGRSALRRIIRLTYNALSVRTGAFMITACVKLLILLLAVFGLIPIWLAVAVEACAIYVGLVFSLRALDIDLE